MAKDKNKERDLASGDNPEERKKTSGKVEKDKESKNDSPKDLESGDNPEERERTNGK